MSTLRLLWTLFLAAFEYTNVFWMKAKFNVQWSTFFVITRGDNFDSKVIMMMIITSKLLFLLLLSSV